MRVLVVSLSSPDTICRRLHSAGLEVSAFFPDVINLGDFGGITRPTALQTPYRLHTAPVFPTAPYVYSRWTKGLYRTIQSIGPDVLLYVGEPSELACAQVATQLRRARPDARLGVYVFENIERVWRGKLKWLRGIAELTVLSTLDFAACASEGAVERLLDLGLSPERARIIYPEVDAEVFAPGDASGIRKQIGPEHSVIVGYAGRMAREKGIDVLVDAIALLPERYRLLLLGSGHFLEQLTARWNAAGLTDRVMHVPRVPQQQVPLYLRAMDVFVLPSRSIDVWQEQYGRVLPQAMLSETAVVGSDSGAIPEVIGDTGLIVPEEDPHSLAGAIQQLGEDSQQRIQLANAARQRALTTFVDTYRTQLADWIRQAVDLPRKPGD